MPCYLCDDDHDETHHSLYEGYFFTICPRILAYVDHTEFMRKGYVFSWKWVND